MFVVLNNKDNIGIFLGGKRNLIINNNHIWGEKDMVAVAQKTTR